MTDEQMQELKEAQPSWMDGRGLVPDHPTIDQQIAAAVPMPKASVEFRAADPDPMPSRDDSAINQDANAQPGGSTPLLLIQANDGAAKGSIIYGTVNGFDVAPAATAVSNNDHGWVELAMSYDSTAGTWTVTGATLDFGATVPTRDATHAYISLGRFSVTGIVATAEPALTGSQTFVRTGNSTSASWTELNYVV